MRTLIERLLRCEFSSLWRGGSRAIYRNKVEAYHCVFWEAIVEQEVTLWQISSRHLRRCKLRCFFLYSIAPTPPRRSSTPFAKPSRRGCMSPPMARAPIEQARWKRWPKYVRSPLQWIGRVRWKRSFGTRIWVANTQSAAASPGSSSMKSRESFWKTIACQAKVFFGFVSQC